MIQAEQLAKLWPLVVHNAALDEIMPTVLRLKPNLKRWALLRHKTVKCLREMSEDLHNHNKNVAISKTVASSTGIIAGVIGIIGIGLAPVTAGASLGLTIAAGVLGGTSALTHAGSTIAGHVLDKKRLRMLEELTKEENEELGIGEEYDKPTTEEGMRRKALIERLFKLHPWVQTNQLRHKADTVINKIDDTDRSALRITLPVMYFLTGTSSSAFSFLASFKAGAAVAGAAARVAPKVVLGVGGALSALTLPIDIVSVVLLANEFKGGAKSTLGKEFHRMANKFEAQVESIQRLLKYEKHEDDTLPKDLTLKQDDTLQQDETLTQDETLSGDETLTQDETSTEDETLTQDERLTQDEALTQGMHLESICDSLKRICGTYIYIIIITLLLVIIIILLVIIASMLRLQDSPRLISGDL